MGDPVPLDPVPLDPVPPDPVPPDPVPPFLPFRVLLIKQLDPVPRLAFPLIKQLDPVSH